MSLFRKKSIDLILRERGQSQGTALARHLGVRDLTAFGIAAIIGAGIFSTIGKASSEGGPGVILLFLFTAMACSFAAFAYAEFASLLPVSGSAYTYSYVVFGELFAWIIGWALIMEYAIGNVTVAISWSDYFTSLVQNVSDYKIKDWLCMDYFTAKNSHAQVSQLMAKGHYWDSIVKSPETGYLIEGFYAWEKAPRLGSLAIIFDLPALAINVLITWLVYRGIKESRNASNIMVLIKLAVVLVVIFVGAFYVDPKNWDPFLPNKLEGLLKGISSVFFAYIGFDAISTTAEECRNPQRDMPRGILYSIVICTVLYVAIALVITGIVKYYELNVGDPLAYVFEKVGDLQWLSGVIAISAVVAMASVMLVFQLGQPRIWMSMSRDGLLPPAFARIHPKFRTPSFSTIITGLLVAVPIFFVDISMVTDICSAGTLFAFCLVCGGVLKLKHDGVGETQAAGESGAALSPKFRTPFIPGRFIIPLLFLAALAYLFYDRDLLHHYIFPETWAVAINNLPLYIFFAGFAVFAVMAVLFNFSLIPSLGLLCCFYMLSQLGYKNWLYFTAWLVLGLFIYFVYGRRHSKLAPSKHTV